MKRKLILLSLVLLATTGCSIVRIDNKNLDKSLDIVLSGKNNLRNNSFEGYKYYVPHGLRIIEKYNYNQVIRYKDTNFYLYVDIVSYFYKNKIKYSNNDVYYFKELCYNNNDGYISVKKTKNKYFIEYVYNYAKIESYVNKDDLNDAVVNISYILSSIKYNRNIIKSFIGENKLNYTEESFSLFGKSKDTSSFLNYVDEYDKYYDKDGEFDEDQINIDSSDDK